MLVAVALLSFALACGGPEEPPAELPPPLPDEQCPEVSGLYAADFTLRHVTGTCDGAREHSTDPLEFDGEGHFVSPFGGVVSCETVQSGCRLLVRCRSAALGSRAQMEAVIDAAGDGFTGESIVSGSYQGCTEVAYAVRARRAPRE